MIEHFKIIHEKQVNFFNSYETLSYSFRLKNLTILENILIKYESELLDCLKEDLGKSHFDGFGTELGMLQREISLAKNKLKKWMIPKKVGTNFINFPSSSWRYPSPFGNTLILSPWNYPLLLSLSPCIGSMAAGNTIFLRPSEFSQKTSHFLQKIIADFFPLNFFTCQVYDAQQTSELLDLKWNYIFFTGSTKIGKIVYEKAAKNLTPVTLELGGKSPCIISDSAMLEIAANRVAWGKFSNAGQTCVAPDYLLIHETIFDQFIQLLEQKVLDFYSSNPEKSPDYARIINEQHLKRLINLAESSLHSKEKIKYISKEKYFAPIILKSCTINDPIMQEEIFGPILPCFKYKEKSEILRFIEKFPNPLAFYYFGENDLEAEFLTKRVSFGGGCWNDTLMHLSNEKLAFGGVGSSGMGSYGGEFSFNTFTHFKSVLKQKTWFDIPLRYPPFKDKLKWLKFFLKI